MDYFHKQYNKYPSLAVLRIGGDLEMERYVYAKKSLAFHLGIQLTEYCFPSSASYQEVERCIHQLKQNKHINGIIVQLPLPSMSEYDR